MNYSYIILTLNLLNLLSYITLYFVFKQYTVVLAQINKYYSKPSRNVQPISFISNLFLVCINTQMVYDYIGRCCASVRIAPEVERVHQSPNFPLTVKSFFLYVIRYLKQTLPPHLRYIPKWNIPLPYSSWHLWIRNFYPFRNISGYCNYWWTIGHYLSILHFWSLKCLRLK